jgi:hypothetical protein
VTTQSYFKAVVLAQSEVMPAAVGSKKGLICCNDLKLYPCFYQSCRSFGDAVNFSGNILEPEAEIESCVGKVGRHSNLRKEIESDSEHASLLGH